jgi:hypothetical protein
VLGRNTGAVGTAGIAHPYRRERRCPATSVNIRAAAIPRLTDSETSKAVIIITGPVTPGTALAWRRRRSSVGASRLSRIRRPRTAVAPGRPRKLIGYRLARRNGLLPQLDRHRPLGAKGDLRTRAVPAPGPALDLCTRLTAPGLRVSRSIGRSHRRAAMPGANTVRLSGPR